MASSATGDRPRDAPKKCFLHWLNLQKQDLDELLQTLEKIYRTLEIKDQDREDTINQLKEKVIQHFQEYINERKELAKSHVSSYFAPPWTSTTENSLLWIAGCRPSVMIRLFYALCGSEVEINLAHFIQQSVRLDSLGGLSTNQIKLADELHIQTMKQEDMLSSKFATLQEDVADNPFARIARDNDENSFAVNHDVNRAFERHEKDMLNILEEADRLRLNVLKELINILSPIQAVQYLAAGKKLHLCLHQWGNRKDDLMLGKTDIG